MWTGLNYAFYGLTTQLYICFCLAWYTHSWKEEERRTCSNSQEHESEEINISHEIKFLFISIHPK